MQYLEEEGGNKKTPLLIKYANVGDFWATHSFISLNIYSPINRNAGKCVHGCTWLPLRPNQGSWPCVNISHRVTPNIHVSVAWEKVLVLRLSGAHLQDRKQLFFNGVHTDGEQQICKKNKLNVIIYLGELKSKKSGTSQFTHHAKGTFRCSCMT